jgi:hypothetical protein
MVCNPGEGQAKGYLGVAWCHGAQHDLMNCHLFWVEQNQRELYPSFWIERRAPRMAYSPDSQRAKTQRAQGVIPQIQKKRTFVYLGEIVYFVSQLLANPLHGGHFFYFHIYKLL